MTKRSNSLISGEVRAECALFSLFFLRSNLIIISTLHIMVYIHTGLCSDGAMTVQ